MQSLEVEIIILIVMKLVEWFNMFYQLESRCHLEELDGGLRSYLSYMKKTLDVTLGDGHTLKAMWFNMFYHLKSRCHLEELDGGLRSYLSYMQ